MSSFPFELHALLAQQLAQFAAPANHLYDLHNAISGQNLEATVHPVQEHKTLALVEKASYEGTRNITLPGCAEKTISNLLAFETGSKRLKYDALRCDTLSDTVLLNSLQRVAPISGSIRQYTHAKALCQALGNKQEKHNKEVDLSDEENTKTTLMHWLCEGKLPDKVVFLFKDDAKPSVQRWAAHVVRILRRPATTATIHVKRDPTGIEVDTPDAKASEDLFQCVAFNTTDKEYMLDNDQIDDTRAAALADGLKVNAVLTNLNIADNHIGHVGAAALGEGLKVNAVMTNLNLSMNQIGPTGATALGDALKVNAVLTNLNLFRNKIGDVGAAALGEGLKVNAVLTYLNIGLNQIGPTGATALGDALKVNAVTVVRTFFYGLV